VVSGRFDLAGRVAVITGGAGLLGVEHAAAIAEAGGVPVLVDVDAERARAAAEALGDWIAADVTVEADVEAMVSTVLERHGRIDVLVNNAARNPKVEQGMEASSRLERMAVAEWDADLAVGLTAAFLCSRAIGAEMARAGRGAIVNVASDLALISPDQRLYAVPGLPPDEQPVKPVSY
jgi:NAD(P)-dependent dehydrogenase (short-subunit alcohol dehydrogenase family)